jgi:hypothetical protein
MKIIAKTVNTVLEGFTHRYLKNIDCSSFVMYLLLAPHLPRHFFASATNSTSETNKSGRSCY